MDNSVFSFDQLLLISNMAREKSSGRGDVITKLLVEKYKDDETEQNKPPP